LRRGYVVSVKPLEPSGETEAVNDRREPKAALRVAIITYDHPHLKTEQLVQRLLLRSKTAAGPTLDLKLLALPFTSRQSRAISFAHRPDQEKAVATRELAGACGLEFLACTYDSIPEIADYYLVAGAGIIPASGIGSKKIINVHPGIIPSARGLDAFKWSIVDGVPLGVTMHFIDAEVDAGKIITVVRTPVFRTDSIEVLARRHYELELDVECEFLAFLDGKDKGILPEYPANAPRMRMPAAIEKEMFAKFEEYKHRFAI
jgi:phosphoribosylglycinamide formyltransferase 1